LTSNAGRSNSFANRILYRSVCEGTMDGQEIQQVLQALLHVEENKICADC